MGIDCHQSFLDSCHRKLHADCRLTRHRGTYCPHDFVQAACFVVLKKIAITSHEQAIPAIYLHEADDTEYIINIVDEKAEVQSA